MYAYMHRTRPAKPQYNVSLILLYVVGACLLVGPTFDIERHKLCEYRISCKSLALESTEYCCSPLAVKTCHIAEPGAWIP